MANYDKETKFYWLQLKEDFFEDDSIQWLEEQKPNGRDYAYFYLKLCLKSLKSNGILIRQVGNILIPYDNKKLAELTKMDFDTVTVAMELLKQIGLIQVLDGGEIYVTQLENLIGSVSKGALKKQQQRLLSGQKVDKCPPKIKIKLKDKDINKDKSIYSPAEQDTIPYQEIINYLNLKTNKHFKHNTSKTKSLIKARIKEGFAVEDFKEVIDKKTNEWLEDSKMNCYLRPETLFGTKFESYLNEKEKSKTNNIFLEIMRDDYGNRESN
jgi:uncharacterized phage protein (TIGR02220 family)/predicted phage replisome organizer